MEIISLDHNELVPPHAYFSYGIHPAEVGLRQLNANLLEHPRCLALGEAGLDRLAAASFPDQLEVFERQARQAEEAELPLILHCVKAWNEMLAIRKKIDPRQPWIFHGFRKINLLESILKEGVLISIGTAVLYDKRLQKVVPAVPDDMLFLETDSDEAHGIEEVYGKVAELKGISVPALQEIISANFSRTFRKLKPGD